MCHWLSPDTPVRVSSFGGLQHFRKSGKPLEAGDATRCLDCAYERQCPYSAKRGESPLPALIDHMGGKRGSLNLFRSVYLDRIASGYTSWPVTPLVDGIPDIENVTEALAHGPYGKCVYESDNDVCDNQVWPDSRFSDTRLPARRPANHTYPLLRRSSTSNTHQAQLSLSPWSPIPPWSVNDRPVCTLLMARSSAT